MVERLKCKVARYDSKAIVKKGDLALTERGLIIAICNEDKLVNKAQHLCFTSERALKDGDWIYDRHSANRTYQYFEKDCGKLNPKVHHQKRIEATTDKTLVGVPLVGKPFLQKYVEKLGYIDEILIDLTRRFIGINHNNEEDWSEYEVDLKRVNLIEYVATTRKDGTVITSKVKTEWNSNDVIDFLYKFNCEKGEFKDIKKELIANWFNNINTL